MLSRINNKNQYYIASDGTLSPRVENDVGIPGAHDIIKAIEKRRSLKKLILANNELGDDGCKVLFHFLGSEKGRQHKISVICVNSSCIGDKGLEAISEYLAGNSHLKELILQNNIFEGEPEVVMKFISAVNSSQLEVLSMASNEQLSDPFLALFLPKLDLPTLRELRLSSTGLSSRSAPVIISYLISPRSSALERLTCNWNSLGLRSIRSIVSALRRSNFTLLKLEVNANQLKSNSFRNTNATEEEEEEEEEKPYKVATKLEDELKKVLLRNEMLRSKVHKDALFLLPRARLLLLSSARHLQALELSNEPNENPFAYYDRNSSIFPFFALPAEIQHEILMYFSPTLSSAQCFRIFKFASSPSTLIPRSPILRSGKGCIPDPSCVPFRFQEGGPDPCKNGQCMGLSGSIRCHMIEEQMLWLKEIGCTHFERADSELEVLDLLK